MCKVIEDFKISLIEDGKSSKTIESYVGDTADFVTFLEEKGMDFNEEIKRFYICIPGSFYSSFTFKPYLL